MDTWTGRNPVSDLPSYFGEAAPAPMGIRLVPAVAGVANRASERRARPRPMPAAQTGATGLRDSSPTFSRMIRLGTGGLPAAIDSLRSRRTDGSVTLGALRLQRPEATRRGGWVMTGRVSTLFGLHAIPVSVEMWPVHREYCRITMTPKRAVIVTGRYFRKGHRLLDILGIEMGIAAAGLTQSPSPAKTGSHQIS